MRCAGCRRHLVADEQQQQLSKCEEFFRQQCIPALILPGPVFSECEENQIKCWKQLQQQCDAISIIDLQLEIDGETAMEGSAGVPAPAGHVPGSTPAAALLLSSTSN